MNYSQKDSRQFAAKQFLIKGRSFNKSNVGISKDLMVIKKGILKFTLFELER